MKPDHTSWAPGPTDRLRAKESVSKKAVTYAQKERERERSLVRSGVLSVRREGPKGASRKKTPLFFTVKRGGEQ